MIEKKRLSVLIQRAADRAAEAGYAEATDKQVWFLASLLAEKGLEADEVGCGALNTNATLTSREASGYIDRLTGAQAARDEAAAQVREISVAKSANVAAERARDDGDVAAAFPQEWASADALTGSDRREAKRLLRRRFEALA